MLEATSEERAKNLQVVCYTNIANCYFKLKEYHKAQENATKALELDPSHTKAKLRKCQAVLMLKDLDLVETLVAEIETDMSSNEALAKQLAGSLTAIKKRHKAEMKAYTARQRKKMKKMFT